jgi:hypothetical protein
MRTGSGARVSDGDRHGALTAIGEQAGGSIHVAHMANGLAIYHYREPDTVVDSGLGIAPCHPFFNKLDYLRDGWRVFEQHRAR